MIDLHSRLNRNQIISLTRAIPCGGAQKVTNDVFLL